MKIRQKLAQLSSLEWFILVFSVVIVAGVGYALGVNSAINDANTQSPGSFYNEGMILEQDESSEPLQAQPSNFQSGNPEPQPPNNNPQSPSPSPPQDEVIYPVNPDPGICKPYQPTVNMECLD